MDELVICPGCRRLSGDALELRTLERTGDLLVCACGRRYPIVAGVPILLADPASFLANEAVAIHEADLEPEVAALLAIGPDDQGYTRLLDHLSVYLDAHWGDRADPPPDGPAGDTGAAALVARIAERSRVRVERAVELGCSTGRFVAELARGADHVVGVDLQIAALRRARRLLAGERLAYNRRIVGHHYRTVHASAGDLAIPDERVTLLCSDALDPPLVPGVFDRVVALNLLDSVARPRTLVAVLDGLCAPGGEILLASPYAWASATMDLQDRLGGADPAADVRDLFTTGFDGRYTVEDEAELPWTLRREARVAIVYTCHYLRLRKRGPGTSVGRDPY
jgi:SAM-dependent methyltransferase/uncharacterized protein YbaR (Trm112 family)